jgi:hypothetical protein
MQSLPPPVPRNSAPVLPPQAGAPGKDKPMTQSATGPAAQTPSADATKAMGMMGAFSGIFFILPLLFLIVFHTGAGYLSYQKNGSAGWAFLSFLFAYFYYPYYAFTSAPAAPATMMGGIRKLLGHRR